MKKLSLTFDDGPGPYTPAILDVLAKHDVRATFFMIGRRMAGTYAATACRVWLAGHVIGNHTWNHSDLRNADAGVARAEITGLGWFFRPPYGRLSLAAMERVNACALRLAMWDIDGMDWTLQTADEICAMVDSQVGDGGIILLHDGDSRDASADMSRTVEATDRIITRYKSEGFEFVPLDQMTLPGTPRRTSL